MELIHVGLCLSDRDFALALARGIARENRGIQFHVENGYACPVVLVDEASSVACDTTERPKVDRDQLELKHGDSDGSGTPLGSNYVQLTEIRSRKNPDAGILYRYESCSVLVRELILQYHRITGCTPAPKCYRKGRVICFSSFQGGVGLTASAIAVARTLKMIYGRNCLYLSFPSVNDYGSFLLKEEDSCGDERNTLCKLLYFLGEGREQNATKPMKSGNRRLAEVPAMESESDGMDLPGNRDSLILPLLEKLIRGDGNPDYLHMGVYNELQEDMGTELTEALLLSLDQLGCYDYYILDLGNTADRRAQYLIRQSDCYVLMQQAEAQEKNQRGEIGKVGRDEREELRKQLCKTATNAIPVWSGIGRKEANVSGEHSLRWDREAFVITGDGIEMNLHSDFGGDIALLAKSIAECCGEPGETLLQGTRIR